MGTKDPRAFFAEARVGDGAPERQQDRNAAELDTRRRDRERKRLLVEEELVVNRDRRNRDPVNQD